MKQLAERRTDIFGVGDEETAIGKKIGEEDTRKDEKVRFCFESLLSMDAVYIAWCKIALTPVSSGTPVW